jgi:hypothetical protein
MPSLAARRTAFRLPDFNLSSIEQKTPFWPDVMVAREAPPIHTNPLVRLEMRNVLRQSHVRRVFGPCTAHRIPVEVGVF